MKRLLLLICLGWITFSNSSSAAPAKTPDKAPVDQATPAAVRKSHLALAQDGKALQPIVISPQASDGTRLVAKELAEYLGRITGTDFKVQEGSGSNGIVLGTLSQFPAKELATPLELRGAYDGVEAYAIRTEPKRVLLLGLTETGASHAAYRFLETLGCRWFFPGKNWEVVPSQNTLNYSVNESSRPAVLARRVWPGFGLWDERAKSDDAAWNRRNRMAQSFRISTGHAWETIVAVNKEIFDKHPEYFALVKQPDGSLRRQGPMIELGNPAVRQLVTQWALNIFRDHPSEDMVSVDPADGLYKNESPESKAYGASVSDQVFGLANEVARAVAKKYPGKMVGLLAYSNHADPPSFPLEPNVYVQLTHGFNFSGKGYTFEELLKQWEAKTSNLGMYAYLSIWNSDSDWDRLPGAPVRKWAAVMSDYAVSRKTSVDAERSSNWGPRGLGYYVVSRVLWNPDTDIDKLLQDFYGKAFGPAAGTMKRYYERLDAENAKMSRDLIGMAMNDLDEAAHLAKDRPDVQARLDDLKGYLIFISLREHYDTLRNASVQSDKDARTEAALKMYSHVYRTRYSYMEHWTPMMFFPGGMGLEDPAWAHSDPSPKPWQIEPELSHEEIEKQFQEVRKLYPVQPSEEKIVFSNDLVPVQFPGAEPVETTYGGENGEANFALYSVRGEPLVLSIVMGAYVPNMKEGSYKVTDSAGKNIAQGPLPQDKQSRRLEVKVPRPGLYYWQVTDESGGARITMPGDQPVVLMMDKKQLGTGSLPLWYFYVPKGTRNIQFHWYADGGTGGCQVRDPDNKVVGSVIMPVGIGGALATFAVADGHDGKLWSLHHFHFARLEAVNFPNFLSMSPHMMMVPREVAIRDGLSIRAR